MATLYVENIPDDLYEALRSRAKGRHRSIAAEVLALLEENVPTPGELKARQELFRQVIRMHKKLPKTKGPFTSDDPLRSGCERGGEMVFAAEGGTGHGGSHGIAQKVRTNRSALYSPRFVFGGDRKYVLESNLFGSD